MWTMEYKIGNRVCYAWRYNTEEEALDDLKNSCWKRYKDVKPMEVKYGIAARYQKDPQIMKQAILWNKRATFW